MALTIYGSPRSRKMRVLWAAAELGLDYQHVPLAFDDPALKQSPFLAINPAGTIPAIVDDGFALAESLAVNLYLARKYGSSGEQPLYPASPEDQAQAWRWSLWAQGHLEPWVQRDALLAPLRAAIGDRGEAMIHAALTHLDQALADRRWLLGDEFTVADLNVAGVLSPSRAESLDFGDFPRAADWLACCYARPAALETRRRFT